MHKILIIQTAFLGDVILSTCIAEKIHAQFPETKIDFLVRKGSESLFANHPYLNEILIWDKNRNRNLHLLKTLFQIHHRKYDKVIDVQRFFSTGLLTVFSGAKERIGFNKNPLSWLFDIRVRHQLNKNTAHIHEIDRNLLLIRHFTDDSFFKSRLYPSGEDERSILKYTEHPFITISPGSVWFTKRLPSEKWVSFIQQLPSHWNIYLLSSSSDAAICDQIVTGVSSRTGLTSLAGKLTLLQSAALMAKARMNYCNDSGPLHLASAVNAPVTAVYCSTIPAFGFAPLSDQRFIVETVNNLYCRPCGLHGRKKCPEGHFRCAYEITNEQLLGSLAN